MNRRLATTLAGVALVVVAAGCGDDGGRGGGRTETVAPAPGETEVRAITGTGTGVVRGTPDTLEVEVGVETRAASAAEALARNGERAQQVLEALREAGVAEDDVQTSQLYVSPVFDEDGEQIEGYEVSNALTATLRELDRAGEVIDAAAAVAGDEVRVSGVYFTIEDNSELVARARAEAIETARAQAEQLAASAGVELGDIISIEEASTPTPPPVDADEQAADDAETGRATPIEPGTEELLVDVVVRFAIG